MCETFQWIKWAIVWYNSIILFDYSFMTYKNFTFKIFASKLMALSLILVTSCSPVSGPDKTFAGGLLGSGWGAGAGAIIGNQTGGTGAGIAIGAGLGLASGLIAGGGFDVAEGYQLDAERRLASLEGMSVYNQSQISRVQKSLNRQVMARENKLDTPFVEVFFDTKRASLLRANVSRLEKLASHVRTKRIGSYNIKIKGFSTDFQTRSTNQSLIDARVNTVETLLVSYGIPAQYIKRSDVEGNLDYEIVGNPRNGDLTSSVDGDGSRLNNRVEVSIEFFS